MRQHQRREYVGRRGSRADDVQTDCVRPVAVAPLHDGFEHRQCPSAQGVKGPTGAGVTLQHLDQSGMLLGGTSFPPLWIVQPLRNHGVVHAGMLPQIEGREVESKRIDPRKQPTHQEVSRVHAAMRTQTEGDQVHVAPKLRRTVVAVGTAVEVLAGGTGVSEAALPHGGGGRAPKAALPA